MEQFFKQEYSDLIIMFEKPVGDDLSFVICWIMLLEETIGRFVQWGHEELNLVSNNSWDPAGGRSNVSIHYNTSSALIYCKPGRIHLFMFFMPYSHHTIRMCQLKSRPGKGFSQSLSFIASDTQTLKMLTRNWTILPNKVARGRVRVGHLDFQGKQVT